MSDAPDGFRQNLYPNNMSLDEWESRQIARLTEKYPNGLAPYFPNNATIDHDGFRHVFCVENSRGVRRYFDKSQDAIDLARESKFQPCRLIQMPICPRWMYHNTPLDELVKLIEIELAREA